MSSYQWMYSKARSIYHCFAAKGAILMYHRVGVKDSDPWGICVSSRHFNEQMDVLRRFNTLPMSQITESLLNGRMKHNTVGITFDDGYADNLQEGLPVLQKHNIPATIYVTSGRIGQKEEFWWDQLEKIILDTNPLPEQLKLKLGDEPFAYFISQANDSYAQGLPVKQWKAWLNPPIIPRQKLYLTLWQKMSHLSGEHKQQVLADLKTWSGSSNKAERLHLPLTEKELLLLASSPLIEIGAHTVTHPVLTVLAQDKQVEEIKRSKQQLEQMVGYQMKTFSYPHGQYSTYTGKIVQEAGFVASCTTQEFFVTARTNPFELPRFQVLDWNGEEFERQLTHWLRNVG